MEVNTPLRELGEQRKLSERQPVDDVAVGTVDAHRIGGQPPGHPALAGLPRVVGVFGNEQAHLAGQPFGAGSLQDGRCLLRRAY